ncbi:MAG TPA: pilus assembly PilX N-terminal domain-containing protein [Candidatus Sulfotelmatobacter sp.]|jgi:hypothetical protein|nr:pilus assembly PilX N-terminal domain-containing protein [Candidatus Sulfotelmatobacter sp.]
MQEYQKGQILLIVVLVMVTALTVGLSVAARSIMNTKISQDSANSERAFSAAEAGIEQSLTHSSATSGSFISNNSAYQTNIISVSGTQFALNNGAPILKDSAVDLWLSQYPNYTPPWTGNNLTFYWGNVADICDPSPALNTMAALEIIVLSGNQANPVMARYGVDPCSPRSLSNKFHYVSVGGIAAGNSYRYKDTIVLAPGTGLYVRVIPLYASTIIAVTGCDSFGANCVVLPSQGSIIQATGTSGNTQRKIVTYQHYPQLPPEAFQYSLFFPQ